jgi:hypothetical protein
VGQVPHIPFAEYVRKVEQCLEHHYGIRVVTMDVPGPLIGDLDGAAICIDYAVTPEQRLFLLAHLFGHTVQWNTRPEAFELGRPRKPPVDPAELPELMEYERQAARYALGMLHEIGITELDQWLSDYTACDMEYLRRYYLTGEKVHFEGLWRDGAELLGPQAVPEFVPAQRTPRSGGLVI